MASGVVSFLASDGFSGGLGGGAGSRDLNVGEGVLGGDDGSSDSDGGEGFNDDLYENDAEQVSRVR